MTATTGEGLCGPADPFGRCSSRFHDLQCVHAVSTDWAASEPPRSTFEAALSNFADEHVGTAPAAYGDPGDPDVSYAIPQRTLELASRLNESWGLHGGTPSRGYAPSADELLGPAYGVRQDAYAAMAAEVGRPDLAGEQPQFPAYPDVSAIRAGLGI